MFVNGCERGYTRNEQQTARGLFLVLLSRGKELRAVVRYARMVQCGHFMMASVPVGSDRVTLSGTYGSDGLPVDGERYPGAWEKGVVVPEDVAETFWKGEGGHNGAGSEGPTMKAWAKANMRQLRGKA